MTETVRCYAMTLNVAPPAIPGDWSAHYRVIDARNGVLIEDPTEPEITLCFHADTYNHAVDLAQALCDEHGVEPRVCTLISVDDEELSWQE